MILKVYLIIVVLLVLGCSSKKTSNGVTESSSVEYAEKFGLQGDSLVIYEPWPGANEPIYYHFDESPEKIIVTSTTHLPFLEMLDEEESLVGFPNTRYINSDIFRKKVANSLIRDVGNDGNLNLELIIDLDPDLLVAFDMGTESAALDKVEEAGITVLYNSDYLETSALGRAEWIKFFGYVFNKEEKADSVFKEIKIRYDSLKSLASQVDDPPTVFSGVMYGDTWFLPGGNNWSAQFFKDAGANYLWNDDPSSGWLEVSFETVFSKAANADFWVGTSTFTSLSGLKGQDSRYADFDAFRKENVYNYSKRRNPYGGFDYLESGYARPDLVLADMIHIFHPDLLPDYECYYFEPIK